MLKMEICPQDRLLRTKPSCSLWRFVLNAAYWGQNPNAQDGVLSSRPPIEDKTQMLSHGDLSSRPLIEDKTLMPMMEFCPRDSAY